MEKKDTTTTESQKEDENVMNTMDKKNVCLNKESCSKDLCMNPCLENKLKERKCCVMYSSGCNLFYIFLFVFVYIMFKNFTSTIHEIRNVLYSLRNLLNNMQFKLEQLIYNTNTMNASMNNTMNSVVKETEKMTEKMSEILPDRIPERIPERLPERMPERIPEKKSDKTEGRDGRDREELNIKNMVQIIENLETLFRSG